MHRGMLLSFVVFVAAGCVIGAWFMGAFQDRDPDAPVHSSNLRYRPRRDVDPSGFLTVVANVKPWAPNAALEEVSESWRNPGHQLLERLKSKHADAEKLPRLKVDVLTETAALLNWEGESIKAYPVLEQLRAFLQEHDELAEDWLYTVIYFQGVTALRRGEDENCIMCRGESSCILPIAPAAVHTYPAGSRLAIRHFTEYLERFPDDLEVRWLLNLAHMTLGEHPGGVDRRFLIPLDHYLRNEFSIGKFRDIGHQTGLNRLNQAGGAIMEDFDNDGFLDIVVTSMDPTMHMAWYRNKGDGTFEDRSVAAGLTKQLGGLSCIQTDFDNDGFMDIFIPRGAWFQTPIRPSLLRNTGAGKFVDVTHEAGLLAPGNSIAAQWADFDNDGFLDLYVCCELQPNLLYRNKGNGTFEEIAAKAGVQGDGKIGKGCAWIDVDNDGFPDLFVTNFQGSGQLFRNNRQGGFTDVTKAMGINGPMMGFSCWAWDFDNDGWLDIFATSYERSIADAVQGLLGKPHSKNTSKLFRNLQGKGFQDMTQEAGLDAVYATMGSNFGDFDNDGFLDFYLGTGDPHLATLLPNRMFKNVGGKRFSEITASSGTGQLQKGHGVACGDWDRDGNVDIFIQMGGAMNGDKYHNILFQNPGQTNRSITVKLVGKKTNRAALGARLKVVTAGAAPLTVHRHVTSGSSFGANPLQQTIGLGGADRVALLEVHWPTSGTTQVFHDIAAGSALEITEFATDFKKLPWRPLPVPR